MKPNSQTTQHTMTTDTSLPSSPFGLHSLSSDTKRTRLPLRAIDARFEVSGDCAEVVIEQIFDYEGKKAVDVIYTFPLPSGASVYRCEMKNGEKTIHACARPAEEAREEFKRQKAAGHRAALVETVRDNLFELRLGNVQPGDSPSILLAYVMPLSDFGDGSRRLRLPVCPGIRYVPGIPEGADGATNLVPDAGRLNPPRIDASHPDAAAFFAGGSICGATDIASPSHPIEYRQTGEEGQFSVLLADDQSVPEKDFILTWKPAGKATASTSKDDPEYLLCSVHAPEEIAGKRGSRDIFFLLDCSGSMSGEGWESLCNAFSNALQQLEKDDCVCVGLFESSLHYPCGDKLQPKSIVLEEKWDDKVVQFGTRGGTEFTSAFQATVQKAKQAKRPVIIAITDGQFGDERRVSELAAKCGIEVHFVGVSGSVNEAALEAIARRTRGTCALCAPGEDMQKTVTALMQHLLSPAIESIEVAGGKASLLGTIPPLRAKQSALVPFQWKNLASAKSKLIDLVLRFSDGSEKTSSIPIVTTAGKAPSILAAKAKIVALLDAGKQNEAVALACIHNILCDGVSFLAFDETEKVCVAATEIEQASPYPANSYGIFHSALPSIAFSRLRNCGFLSEAKKASKTILDQQMRAHQMRANKLRETEAAYGPSLIKRLTAALEMLKILSTPALAALWRIVERSLEAHWRKNPPSFKTDKKIIEEMEGLKPNAKGTEKALSLLEKLAENSTPTIQKKLKSFLEQFQHFGTKSTASKTPPQP